MFVHNQPARLVAVKHPSSAAAATDLRAADHARPLEPVDDSCGCVRLSDPARFQGQVSVVFDHFPALGHHGREVLFAQDRCSVAVEEDDVIGQQCQRGTDIPADQRGREFDGAGPVASSQTWKGYLRRVLCFVGSAPPPRDARFRPKADIQRAPCYAASRCAPALKSLGSTAGSAQVSVCGKSGSWRCTCCRRVYYPSRSRTSGAIRRATRRTPALVRRLKRTLRRTKR